MEIRELQVSTTEMMGPELQRLQRTATGMAVVGAVLAVLGFAMNQDRFFEGYLIGYLFWFGVTAGSLGLLMLHHVVGGGWGFLIRRFLEASTRLLPLMMILFLPILGSILLHGSLFEWTHAEVVQQDRILQAKAPYLNVPFFIARWVLYFVIFILLASYLRKWGDTQDQRSDRSVFDRLNRTSAGGLVAYVLVTTFLTVDWIMSLTPHWFSSILGLLVVVGQGLSTLALMLCLLALLAGDKPLLRSVPTGFFRDLGNLMLAFVLLWAYMSFSQYLIMYSGNLTEEVPYYVRRASGGWGWISLALIPLHFLLPFLILLVGSNIKRSPARLAKVALFLIVMRFVDLLWWVAPNFRETLAIYPADIGAPLLLGGIWLWFWAKEVQGRPVVPLHDPRLEASLQKAVGHA